MTPLVPRNTLAHTHHKEIDAILKDLKFCSRRLKAALGSFKDELRILERLYYKCKNQHRMTLFFKRVPEMRRYGRRLNELDVLEYVDLLRASFVGLDHTNDHKAFKGSWSHVPQKPYVYFLKERLTVCSTLVCKMRERLERAYRHFALAMQSGAFVQLVILFVAISSRMSVLSSELVETLQLGISICDRLLVVVHPTVMHLTISPSEHGTGACSSHVDQDVPSEDTGKTIFPYDPVYTSTVVVEDPSMKTELALNSPSNPAHGSDRTVAQALKKSTTKVAQKPRSKKARKKVDEIDEIFGF